MKIIVDKGNIVTPNTHIHDSSLSWLGTGTSIKGSKGYTIVMGPNRPS
jgi:hypothetical protein